MLSGITERRERKNEILCLITYIFHVKNHTVHYSIRRETDAQLIKFPQNSHVKVALETDFP